MKNILLLITYIEYTKRVRFYLPLPFTVIVSQRFHLPYTNFYIPTIFTAIPQHIISPIHCIGYRALFKTLNKHFWYDALPCCYDPY